MDPLKSRKLRSILSPATPPTPHQLNKLLTTVISNGQKCHFKVILSYVCCGITLRKWIFCSLSCFSLPSFCVVSFHCHRVSTHLQSINIIIIIIILLLYYFSSPDLTMWPKIATRRFLSFGPKKRPTDPEFSPFYSGLPGKCYNSTSYRKTVTASRSISNSY